MANEYYRPGVGSVGQYQMSGKPWVTSSFSVPKTGDAPLEIKFPYVTQWLLVQNYSTQGLQVGFSSLGTTGSAGGGSNNFLPVVTIILVRLVLVKKS